MRRHPELITRWASGVGGINLPEPGPLLRGESGELNDRDSIERIADTVVTDGPPQNLWYSVISEFETRLGEAKLRQTIFYAITRLLQTERPVYVVIVSPDPKAHRFTGPTTMTEGAVTVTVDVVIIGPQQIPVFTTAEEFVADPEIAPFVIMAHGKDPKVQAAFARATPLCDDAVRLFEDAVCMAPEGVGEQLEELMATTDWPVYSRIGREQYGKGREEGREVGREEGRAEGEARSLLAILEARGLDVTEGQRARIESTTDPQILLRWIMRASTATSTVELFDDHVT